MKTLSRTLAALLASGLPLFAFAQNNNNLANFSGFKGIIAGTTLFINSYLVPAVFALAFIVFLWGMFTTFILGGGDEEKQEKGKHLMMYAIAGFVLMVSIWGIVHLIAGSLGLEARDINGILPVGPDPRNP